MDFLKKGDKIGIVATARKVTKAELEPAIETLRSWGLEPVLGKNLFGDHHQYSGSDEDRRQDLQAMLDDVTVKAVISARGGYGTMRIVDGLNFSAFKKHPKWIIGFSDITVLHSHLNNMGVESIHAPMPLTFPRDAESVESLRKALFGETLSYTFSSNALNRAGNAEGIIVGGNLSLLYALQSSASDIDTKGKILFIEDLDEYLYHIDRMMLSLKRSGKLDKLAGLVVGGMSDMRDNPIPFGKTAEEIIIDTVKEYSYPVSFGFPAGHGTKNMALHFGRKATLNVSGKETILSF